MTRFKVPGVPDLAEALTGDRDGKYYRRLIRETRESPLRKREVELMLRGLATTESGLFFSDEQLRDIGTRDLGRILGSLLGLLGFAGERVESVIREIGRGVPMKDEGTMERRKVKKGDKGKEDAAISVHGSSVEKYIEIGIRNYSVSAHGKPYVARLFCKENDGKVEVGRYFFPHDRHSDVTGEDGEEVIYRRWRITDPRDGEIFEIRSGEILPKIDGEAPSKASTWWGVFDKERWIIQPLSGRKVAIAKVLSKCGTKKHENHQ